MAKKILLWEVPLEKQAMELRERQACQLHVTMFFSTTLANPVCERGDGSGSDEVRRAKIAPGKGKRKSGKFTFEGYAWSSLNRNLSEAWKQ